MEKEEIEANYKKLVLWTVDRENSKDEQKKKEYVAGVNRVEEYEDEFKARGYKTHEIRFLYGTIVFDGNISAPDQPRIL